MFVSNLHIKSVIKIILIFFLVTFLLPVNSWSQSKEVVALKGDGIYRLLTRHGLSSVEYMDDFIALNKSSLGRNNSLLAGVKYKLPDSEDSSGMTKSAAAPSKGTGKIMHYNIFGNNYADVEIESNDLKGAVYYIVGGHGGPDPGAVGKYNGQIVCEDEYAYDVSLRLARNLIAQGATVYLITRDKNDGIRDALNLKADKDEVCYPNLTIPLNQTRRLRQRTDAVNQLYKKHKGSFQRMIALHIDSRSKRENIDIFFYHDRRSKTGEKASEILRNTIEAKYRENQPSRGYTGTVSSRNLYIVRNTWPTAIFIELGNMNHQRDVKRLVIPNNRQAVANWLTLGLKTDFKTNK
ncbi:N-acetylmuramoyl-L-alanine amidase family protein [Draconibacterium halophilum]|uniref:N-acetylmuramoyl-L-alanine amidase n=1 Tax=Draconibacterium halophilum TaxID=2706887 RepID=A0A6C0REV8_9BACT|nr:N-acetylmuramoyl-L-alanine amidase [Draconibacterium halophilum]QIA08930.1 N-acetylmuramoyl-L-alanine amidase [Draconibacterium halophilum]